MGEAASRARYAQKMGWLPGPMQGKRVESSIVYRTNVVDDVREQSDAWRMTDAEIAQFETEYARKWEKHESSALSAQGALSACHLRERIAQDSAMDAPFTSLRRGAFLKRQGHRAGEIAFCESSIVGERAQRAADEAGSRERSELLAGLVTSKTSDTKRIERIEIDRVRSRISRLQKAVRNGAHALDADAHLSNHCRWRRLFVTLTYREVEDWQPRHIAQFAKRVREWFRRNANVPFRMQWVLELQKRGAVHYHCMIWVPARLYMPHPDKQGWWPWGSSNIPKPKGGIQRPVSYMAKYASKVGVEQCNGIPKGARMHGCNGLPEEGRRWVRWWRSPVFARDALGGAADIRKVPGGYMDKLTGEFHASPWKVTITPAGRVIAWRELPASTHTVN